MNNIDTTFARVGTPAGADPGMWEHDRGRDYRLVYSARRGVEDRPDTLVLGSAVQFGDGSIDTGIIEAPGVHVEVGAHPLTVAQARALAAALLDVTQELDGWTDNRSHGATDFLARRDDG